MSDAVVTLLVAVFGGGTVAALVQGIVSHRKGVRDTDVARDQTAFEQMKVILAEHKDSISTLQSAREKDTCRLDDLSEENRLYRWTLVGVTDRIRQMPPVTPEDLLEYINERQSMLRKDK